MLRMRLRPGEWRALRVAAAERGSSMQALAAEFVRAGLKAPALGVARSPAPELKPEVPRDADDLQAAARLLAAHGRQVVVRPTDAEVSKMTGHREGCGCHKCDSARHGG